MEKSVSWFAKYGILSLEKKSNQWLLSLHYKNENGTLDGVVHAWGDNFTVTLRSLAKKVLEYHKLVTKQKKEQEKILKLFDTEIVK